MTPCVEWTGYVDKEGYGWVSFGVSAHRSAYADHVGPIPPGLEIDHLCRNRSCVNPDHLEAVTRAENARRRSEAQTHCVNGHEYQPETTYVRPDGKAPRACVICRRSAVRRYRAKKKVQP